MSLRELYIDGRLAEEAEHVAEAAGYDGLEHYVMALIEEDLNQIERTIAVQDAINANNEGDTE